MGAGHHRHSRAVVLLLTASCTLLGSNLGGTPTSAATPTFAFPANRVVAVSAARASFTTPADGRLRGEDFAATVAGVAWPDTVGIGASDQMALAGHRLVVFTLDVSEDGLNISPAGDDPSLTAALVIGDTSMPVPLSAINTAIGQGNTTWTSGTGEFAAAVPNHAHGVDLVLSQGSFSQTFNLWKLARVPPAPTVLYRDPERPTVADTTPENTTLSLSNPSDGFSGPALVSLGSVTLGYFPPSGSQGSLSSPDQAVLSVVLNAQYPNNGQASGINQYLGAQTPVPASLLTFTPAGSAPVDATLSDAGDATGQGDNDDGLFDGIYSFLVPATLTSGTLTIAAGAFSGTEFAFSDTSATVDITAPQTLAVSFPSVTKAVTQPKPPWYGAPLPPTAAAGTKSLAPVTFTGSGGFPIWLAVVLLVLVAGGVVLIQRRRRATPATMAADGTQGGTGVAAPSAETRPAETAGIAAVVESPPTTPVPTESHTPVEAVATPPTDPVVNVLGPIEVQGWRQVPDRRIIEELLCFLALHGRYRQNADQIQLAIWPTGGKRQEVSRKTFHSYLSTLRQCIGAEHLPDATNAAGYRVVGVDSDWERFERLVAQADTSEGRPSIRLRQEALALVRGAPFEGVPDGQYAWVFDEELHIVMTTAIVTCALRAGNDLFALGELADAEKAVEAGLLADRDDEHLRRLRDVVVAARKEGLSHPGHQPEPPPVVDDPDDDGSDDEDHS